MKRQKEKIVVIIVPRQWHARIVTWLVLMKKQQKILHRVFAAGIGGSMEATCGAIIGAVSVLGMINKDAVKTMQGSRRIINRFKEQNGTVVCKELKGITDGVVKRECIDCVKDAALFLEDELK